jgi:prepilin-type N-terminal cleavage/methylation domain-containing protein
VKYKNGFTLVEVLVTLAILGILVFVAVTSFSGTNQRKNLDVAARELMANMLYVQQKNINGNSSYQIMLSPATNSYRVQYDAFNAEKTVKLPTGVAITGNVSTVNFQNDGTLIGHITDGHDYVQLQLASETTQNRFIIVQLATGRIRIDTVAP